MSASDVFSRYQWPDHGIKNSFFHSIIRDPVHHLAPDIVMPITAVFEAGFPRFVFEFSAETQEILKQSDGEFLQAQSLLDYFLSHRVKVRERLPDIVALLVYTPDSDAHDHHRSSASTKIEPLTENGLREFLLHSVPGDPRRFHSILQAVIPTDAANFTVARISFSSGQVSGGGTSASAGSAGASSASSTTTLISRRQSKYNFLDTTRTPRERMLVFDSGSDSVELNTAKSSASDLEALCLKVENQLKRSHIVIQDLQLFVTTCDNKPTLLFCTCCQVTSAQKMMAGEHGDHQGGGQQSRMPPSALEANPVSLARGEAHVDDAELAALDKASAALSCTFSRGDPLGRRKAGSPAKHSAAASSAAADSPSKKKKNSIPSPAASASPQRAASPSSPAASAAAAAASPTATGDDLRSAIERLVHGGGWKALIDGVPAHEEEVVQRLAEVRTIVSDGVYNSAGGESALPEQLQFPARLGEELLTHGDLADLARHLGFAVDEDDVTVWQRRSQSASSLTVHVALSLLDVWVARMQTLEMERLKQKYAPQIRAEATRLALTFCT